MRKPRSSVHPYIPNSAPEAKAAMLHAVAARSVDEFYADVPGSIRLKRKLNLPEPFASEWELVRHVEAILERNVSTRERLSFLGAGCSPHYVPAVCDEINSRSEFLTAYAGDPYEDHGRFQALWEYASMMGELLSMDVVNVPTYDGFQAAATGLRMAARITGRSQVLLSSAIGADLLSKVRDYLKPDLSIGQLPYDPRTGLVDLGTLDTRISDKTAAVFFQNPSYLGVLETGAGTIADVAHARGALCVVGVDPISLGVVRPPADYGADIACGDIQPLGMHMLFGGGHGGFIATRDEERYVMEFPSRLLGIAPTSVEGEYGFGDVAWERTSFAQREGGKEFVGTASALWGITAGVYLALMGPQGMVELGEGIMARARYAIQRIAAIPGVRVPFLASHHFKEFVVDFSGTGKTVEQVNAALLARGIYGGVDLNREFPELGQPALYCVTEVHSKADIDRLVSTLGEVLR